MADQDIVPVSKEQIVALRTRIDDIVGNVFNEETAEDARDTLDSFERWLRESGMYGELACYACYKEAELLIRVAKLDIDVSFRRDMVAWLRDRTDQELQEIMSECSAGVRISVIKARWSRERNVEKKVEDQIAEHKRVVAKKIQELEETGRTDLSYESYMDEWSLPEAPDKETYRAFKESAKNKAIARGASSLGDGSTQYLIPEVSSREENAKMLENKLRRVNIDLHAIANFCNDHNFKVPKTAVTELRLVVTEIGELLDGIEKR